MFNLSVFHNAASHMLLNAPESAMYPHLIGAATDIINSAWRPNTVKSYTAGQNNYFKFAAVGNFAPFPLTPSSLSLWVAHLRYLGLAPGSIKGYLSSVRSLGKLMGYVESP